MHKIRTFSFLTLLLCVVLLLCSCSSSAPREEKEVPAAAAAVQAPLQVYFVDVGQGDCTVFRQGEYTVLIDAGPRESAGRLFTFLYRDLALSHIDALIITHDHIDHTGGLAQILSAGGVDRIYCGDTQTPNMLSLSSLIEQNLARGTQLIPVENGMELFVGEMCFTLYRAERLSYNNENDRSVVTRVRFGNVSFLVAADAEAEAELMLTGSGAQLKADVLRVGHHGAATSTTERFLAAVSPAYAVISVGAGNDYGHPEALVLERLRMAHCSVWTTMESGTVVARTDGSTLTLSSLLPPDRGEPVYIGNMNSKKYHDPACGNAAAIAEKNKVLLYSKEEAERLQLVPAGCCKP